MFIDTHSHLDDDVFKNDLPQVILRAKEAQVEKILIPNINLQTLDNLMQLCKNHQGYLYPMIGLHPEEVGTDYQSQLDQMSAVLNHQSSAFVAIGEIGLDFYWSEMYRREQMDAFEQQIGWAIQHRLPLMIHSRNAHHELMELMSVHRHDNLTGVFHCFTGTKEEAAELLSFEGFKLGIGGMLTFKKSSLPEVLKQAVPLNRIVLETDAPYLAPTPYRGKRNESACIVETARCLSEIYGCEIKNIATETNKNAYFLIR